MRFSTRPPPRPPSSPATSTLILLLCLFSAFTFHCSVSQPQNIEVFFPTSPPPTPVQPLPLPPTPLSPRAPSPPSNKRAVGIAVGVTAASTLLVAGLLFLLVTQCRKKRRVEPRQNRFSADKATNRSEAVATAAAANAAAPSGGHGGGGVVASSSSAAYRFGKFEGNLKGLIVDENGLDVVYWRKLEGVSSKNSFKKEVFKKTEADEKRLSRKWSRRKSAEPVQEIPLLRGKSSSSQMPPSPDSEIGQFSPIAEHSPRPSPSGISAAFQSMEIERQESITVRSPPPPPPPVMSVPKKEIQSPAPPPPPPPKAVNTNPPPPPPPSNSAGKNPPPPPPPKIGMKPPPAPPPKAANNAAKETETAATSAAAASSSSAVKMKPLHWDKVNANVEHSMVWDKIDRGSFQFDGDMMEALFGYVATNRKSPQGDPKQANSAAAAAQVFILDSRKSQNIAIVLKSLTVSRQELIDGLAEGRGLSIETLEKLARIAPAKDEEGLIFGYSGDPSKLAFAESFLFQILRPVPTAFSRVSAMVFRMSYDGEVAHLKEMVKAVEMGCEELRRRGLFLKLLEAVLKAGNRMNAGTSRGNAQAFNLTALRKLSDVKSTDGKTTLLHFVVEEVVRSEGKRCALNRNASLTRSDSRGSKEDAEKDYMMLGLPIVGGLSAEFSNVKRAAAIDYDQFSNACGALEARVTELRHTVSDCATRDGDGGFVREMRGFVASAEQELSFVKDEQKRVIELVRRTTEYYQTGALKDKEANHFQLFVIISDFLGMVDQVCVEIARNAQRRKASGAGGSDPTRKNAAGLRTVKFPNLPEHFMSDKSMSSSGDES
uniref:Formin-like protein n=1 Tax=Kalanchoe fedtschenkoi TaxID=63787 RepID=A0A7N1A7F9_KALFE